MASLEDKISTLFNTADSAPNSDVSPSTKAWSEYPFTSTAFDPAVRNGERIQWLLEHEMDFAGGEQVEYVEVKSGGEPEHRIVHIRDSLPRDYRLEGEVFGGVRIFILKQNWEWRMMVPLSRPALIQLFEENEVPPVYLEVYANNNGGIWSYSTPDAYHLALKLPFGPSVNGAFYLRYSFRTGSTTVILSASARRFPNRLKQIFQSFPSLKHYRPVNDPFLIVSTILDEYSCSTDMERSNLDRVVCHHEAKTGVSLHQYDQSRYSDISAYSSFKRDLHILDAALAVFDRVCAFQVEAATTMLEYRLAFIKACQSRAEQPTWLESIGSGMDKAAASLRLTESSSHNRLEQLRTLRQRIQIQLSVVDSSMRQNDSLINISIAKDGRKDSVAMKTIAALTMVFLPATFVATIFGMVFFQSSTSNGSLTFTVNPKWWLYPAFALPLTIVTVGAWIGWLKWKDPETQYMRTQPAERPASLMLEKSDINLKTKPRSHNQRHKPDIELGPVFELPPDQLPSGRATFGPFDPGASKTSIAKPFTRITARQVPPEH